MGKEDKNEAWKMPDLLIIDGGKGQLSSVLDILEEFKVKWLQEDLKWTTEVCALAKEEETIFMPNDSIGVVLSGSVKLLIQRIRDEAHRFAITANRKARLRTISKSKLDEIEGIGEKTKKLLLSELGSVVNIADCIEKNPSVVLKLVSEKVFNKLKEFFNLN